MNTVWYLVTSRNVLLSLSTTIFPAVALGRKLKGAPPSKNFLFYQPPPISWETHQDNNGFSEYHVFSEFTCGNSTSSSCVSYEYSSTQEAYTEHIWNGKLVNYTVLQSLKPKEEWWDEAETSEGMESKYISSVKLLSVSSKM